MTYPVPLDPIEMVTIGDSKKKAEARLRLRIHLCKILDLPEDVLKHLPGKHNQRDHGGKQALSIDDNKVDRAGDELFDMMRQWHNSSSKESLKELVDYTDNPDDEYFEESRQITLDDLPWNDDDTVTLYRGGVVDGSAAQSWTTDKRWADRFSAYGFGGDRRVTSGAGDVTEKKFYRKDLLVALPWEGEVIVRPDEISKHLPGRHNQKDHGRLGEHSAFYEKEKGAEAAAKKLGGVVTKIKNAYLVQHEDDNANSAFSKTHHIRRETTGIREETRTLKNGDTKKVVVPTYKFYDSISGKEITNRKELERLNKAAPPGVTHVRINPDPNGHLVASWTDSVGRSAAMRSKKHTIGSAAEKFQRLKNFHKELPKIRKQIEEDVAAGNEDAAVLYLIDKTAFRAGSGGDTKAAVQAYGASTLLNKHVKVDGDKVTFDFIGKKGVRIRKTLRDTKLAEIVRKRKTSQYSQPLFDTNYGQVMKYLKSVAGDYKIHDFRTHSATAEALKWIKKRKGPAPSEKMFDKWQKEVGEKVGQHLGNNRSMALNTYIDPHVWDTWRQPEWGQWIPKSQREEKHLAGKHDQRTHAGKTTKRLAELVNESKMFETALSLYPKWAQAEMLKTRLRIKELPTGQEIGVTSNKYKIKLGGTYAAGTMEGDASMPPLIRYTGPVDETYNEQRFSLRLAVHELAHHLDAAMGHSVGKGDFSRSKTWRDVLKKDSTQMARLSANNLSEDFAESVENYLVREDWLRRNFPNRHKFLSEMLSDEDEGAK